MTCYHNSAENVGNNTNYSVQYGSVPVPVPMNRVINIYYYLTIQIGECIMPKEGFKSITVSETVYNRFNDAYVNSKENLTGQGIRSLSGYISYMLEERMMENEVMALHAPRMKKISVVDDHIVLLDSKLNRIAEVSIQNGALYCQLCEDSKCIHVGFAYALPEVYKALSEHGIKGPE